MSSIGQTAGQGATVGDVSGAMSSMPPQLAGMLQSLFSGGGGMSSLGSPQQPMQGAAGQPNPQQPAVPQQQPQQPAQSQPASTVTPGLASLLAYEQAHTPGAAATTGMLSPINVLFGAR
jgi:hypothetical protein